MNSDVCKEKFEDGLKLLNDYYKRRDDLIVDENDDLIRQCSNLYEILQIDHDTAALSTNINRLLETCSLNRVTQSGDNAALLAAHNDQTDVLVALIRSRDNERFVLRPNLNGVNCLGSFFRNTAQLDSLQTVLRALIECAIVPKDVLVVITLHQWLIVSTSNQEHNCRSLNQVIDQLDRFNLFTKLTTDSHVDDFAFGAEVRQRHRQMELISQLLHSLIQPLRTTAHSEKYVARLKQCLVERLNMMPSDRFLPRLLAANQMTKKVLLPASLSKKLVARSSHHMQVMRPVRDHEKIKPTAHMFIVGGFVQAHNATTNEIIRVDVDYLEAVHRTDWFDNDLLEYRRYFTPGQEDAQISRLNNCRQIIQVHRADDNMSREQQKNEQSTTTRGRELQGLTSHAMTRYGNNMVIHGGAGNDTLDSGAQLAAFDITNRRWTPIEQSQRQSKMYGHSTEIWRHRFYTFFGVYEAPGGENSYSSSVKYIDLKRPGDGWRDVINDQGDTNRAQGTPKSRYRQRTILYKDYVAVFGGGHHRAEPEKLTDVFFFDLRRADKLMKSDKPMKNVWVERKILFDNIDPANDDLNCGRIHFSIAPEINGPRVYIAGGLTVSNGQDKLLDSIYEFNIHANNGQPYRDAYDRLVPMKQVRTFNPRKDEIEMRVRRIGTLQSPINYHDSALCDENAVLYFYGGTQLKERLGPTTESNKERVSHFQTLRVNPSRLSTLCRRELLRRKTRLYYRHVRLLNGKLSEERLRLRNLNLQKKTPDETAKDAKRSKLELYDPPNHVNVVIRRDMNELDADNFINWVEGNTFEKLEFYQTMRYWYQPRNSWDDWRNFEEQLEQLKQRHDDLGRPLLEGNIYESEQLKLFLQLKKRHDDDHSVVKFSNQTGKTLLALVKRLQHEPAEQLIDEIWDFLTNNLDDPFLLCIDDTDNGFSALHYICLFGSIDYMTMLNEALESSYHRHELLRQTRYGYDLLTLAFARAENARDFAELIFGHTVIDEVAHNHYFTRFFRWNAWHKSFRVVFQYWKPEDRPNRDNQDNYNEFIKQKASQLGMIRNYAHRDSTIVIEAEFAQHYVSKPSLWDEEKLEKWYLVHDSLVKYLYDGYKRRHEKELPVDDGKPMNLGIESEWPQELLNVSTFGTTSLKDTGVANDKSIDRSDFFRKDRTVTFGDGRIMLTKLKNNGPGNKRVLKIIESTFFTNLMNWRFADVDRRNPRTKWSHFVNYYYPEMSNALFVYGNGDYLLQTREMLTESFKNKFVDGMGCSYYANNIETIFVHSYERLEMNLHSYLGFFDGERRDEMIGKFAELNKRLRWLFKICDALEYMHNKRLQHLDIKPQNIMLESYATEVGDDVCLKSYLNYPQTVKLADLGACKMALNTSTNSNVRRASPMFASPEQINWMSTVSAASDIYSLGHVMAILLLNSDQYRNYALKPAFGDTADLVERNRRLDNFPFTVTRRMKMTDPEKRLPLKLVKRELKRQIRISRIRRIENKTDIDIKAGELAVKPLYSYEDQSKELTRLKEVRQLLETHPDAAFPISVNTIRVDWLHSTLKTSLTTSNRAIFDPDVANITAPVNETLKSNLDVLFACVSNLRSALIRLFLRFHIDLVQLLEQDAEFSFMRMVMVACFCLAPRAIDGLDRFDQMDDPETRRRIASQTSYVANTIYKIAHGTFATGEGWRLFPSVRRLFARFGIDMEDINVRIIQSRHPDWKVDDMITFDEIERGTPIVVSCYEDFSNFPAADPNCMTAGNIKFFPLETTSPTASSSSSITNIIIKTPQKDTQLLVNKNYPSAYHMFQHRRKPSTLRAGTDKINDRAWFVDSLGYSIDLRVNEGLSPKYRLKIENIETPDMFARQLLDQVNAVFYRRQRNLKRILLEKLQSFLLKNHPDVNCGDCPCRLGHPDANIFDLSEKFELAEEGCSITQLVTSFRKSVLGYLEEEYLNAQPKDQLSDAVLFDNNGLYGQEFTRHFDFGFLLEFEECVDFHDETNQSNDRQSIFYVALAAQKDAKYNDMEMHFVELDGSQVKLNDQVTPAKLFDPVQKYFAEHQQKVQSFKTKLYQQVNSRLYSDLVNEIAFEINQTSSESTALIKLYKFTLAMIKSESTAK